MESKGRGVLDTPLSRGTTTVSCSRHSRHTIHPKHDSLGIERRITEPMRAAAGKTKAVALLEGPAFGIDREFHLARKHEARFFAVMGIQFVAGAAAGLHADEKHVEAAIRSCP